MFAFSSNFAANDMAFSSNFAANDMALSSNCAANDMGLAFIVPLFFEQTRQRRRSGFASHAAWMLCWSPNVQHSPLSPPPQCIRPNHQSRRRSSTTLHHSSCSVDPKVLRRHVSTGTGALVRGRHGRKRKEPTWRRSRAKTHVRARRWLSTRS